MAQSGISIDLANFFKLLISNNKTGFIAFYGPRILVISSALLGRGCTKIERHHHLKVSAVSGILGCVAVARILVRDKRIVIGTKDKTEPRVCA